MIDRPMGKAAALLAVLALAACGDRSSAPDNTPLTAGPVALTPQPQAKRDAPEGVVTGGVDDRQLRAAIERYRINRKRGESAYHAAGADLNGDGIPEVLVLFTGEDWCVVTGCSLVVFQQTRFGYQPVSHITRARLPVRVGPDASYGWRDMIVKTGGGPAPLRDVRLGFTGNGYPGNALIQPEPVQETVARSQTVLEEVATFTAGAAQGPGAARTP